MTKSLNGIRVLITRPRPQSEELAQLIQAEGGESFVWPCLDIFPSPTLKNFDKLLKQGDFFIFVSPNAAHCAFAALQPEQKKILRQSKLIAIGEGTAKALEAQACSKVSFPKQPNSEGLLCLPDLENVAGKYIVIFRGQSGRELIADKLLEKQAQVEYVEVYRRQKSQSHPQDLIEAWHKKAFDVVVVTSTESLQNLIEMLGNHVGLLKNAKLTVMNEKMLHLATQLKFRPLWIEKASNSSILDYLKRCLHERL
jgi:uroporphyrinogen-III synthase